MAGLVGFRPVALIRNDLDWELPCPLSRCFSVPEVWGDCDLNVNSSKLLYAVSLNGVRSQR